MLRQFTRQLPPAVFFTLVILAAFATFAIVGVFAGPGADGGPIAGDRIKNGPSLPDFSAKTVTGEDFKISDYKGKVVLLNFWATWCGPCKMEIPELIRLQQKYGPKGFAIVGLSSDDDDATAASFAKENGINYPVVLLNKDLVKQIGSGVKGLPTSILFDKTGKPVWMMEGVSQDPRANPETVIGHEIERIL